MIIVLYIILGIIAIILAEFIFLWICSLFVDTSREYEKDSRFYRTLLNWSTPIALWGARVRIHTNGTEKVPGGQKILFVGNHRSNFDPEITWHVFRKWNLAYISKEENFRIPIFGRLIRKCCFMKIDRSNPRNAVKTINKAADLLKQQEVSIGTYPEGTRNKDADGLLPFHNGMFKPAQKAGVPIAVIALSGTEKIAKNFPLHHTDVYLTVADVIPAQEAVNMRTSEIGERVRENLLKTLNAMENKNQTEIQSCIQTAVNEEEQSDFV